MPGRTDVRRARTENRQAIVDAATELVRGTSYASLTVDDVMRRAGFSRTIFYRHFDDLADLLRRAAGSAFEELFEIEHGLAMARAQDGSAIVQAAIAPAVEVYARHGPLLRAIAEAAAVDDEIATAQQAMHDRFDGLVAEALLSMPQFATTDRDEVRQLARALNHLNVGYLLNTFGRVPQTTPALAAAVLTRIWAAVIDSSG